MEQEVVVILVEVMSITKIRIVDQDQENDWYLHRVVFQGQLIPNMEKIPKPIWSLIIYPQTPLWSPARLSKWDSHQLLMPTAVWIIPLPTHSRWWTRQLLWRSSCPTSLASLRTLMSHGCASSPHLKLFHCKTVNQIWGSPFPPAHKLA